MTPLERLADAIDELVEPRTHREALTPDQAPINARTGKPIHGAVLTDVTSLLDQLAHIQPGGGIADGGHRIPGSRPTAHLEALDALMLIDTESGAWLTMLRMRDRHSVAANLRALLGGATALPQPEQHELANNAHRWVTIAAVITGWEIPPWRPDNTCPLCATRGSLRVRAGDGITSDEVSATCVSCWEHWHPDTIGLLAGHIRAENGETIICTAGLNDMLVTGGCTPLARSA